MHNHSITRRTFHALNAITWLNLLINTPAPKRAPAPTRHAPLCPHALSTAQPHTPLPGNPMPYLLSLQPTPQA